MNADAPSITREVLGELYENGVLEERYKKEKEKTMSVEQNPQSTEQKRQSAHDEPKQDVQPEQELTNEELDQVAGGVGDLTSPEPPPIEPDESIRNAWPKKYTGVG